MGDISSPNAVSCDERTDFAALSLPGEQGTVIRPIPLSEEALPSWSASWDASPHVLRDVSPSDWSRTVPIMGH